jgi:hypothetical protein
MGGSTSGTPKIPETNEAPMYSLIEGKQKVGGQYLEMEADRLKAYSALPPKTQTFDAGRTSKEAAEFGVENITRSRELERLTDPEAARMRSQMGGRVAELSDLAATQKNMDEFAKRSGLTSGYTTGLGGTIGRAAIYDAGTEAGRQARLRSLALQQGYLAQTPAPIGGLDPATAIQAEMQAKAANLQAMQQYQQNIMASGQRLQQSTSDFINQNLGELQQANNVAQQNKQAREQAMYEAAVQKAASENQMTGQFIGAGGAITGAGIGAAIII